MGFSRQEYWSGLPCPPPGELLDPGIELESPHFLQCRWILYNWAAGKAHNKCIHWKKNQPSIFAIFIGIPCSLFSINAFVAKLQHGIIPLDLSHMRNGPEWGSKYALRTWLWACFHLHHGPGSTLGISPEVRLWDLHFKQIHQVTGSMLTGGNSCLQKTFLKQESRTKTW